MENISRHSVLRIYVGKTEIPGSSGEAQSQKQMLNGPVVCSKGVGVNSILCQSCNFWIHKRCPGVKGTLKKEHMLSRCKKCKGKSAPPDSLNSTQVHIDEDMLKAV